MPCGASNLVFVLDEIQGRWAEGDFSPLTHANVVVLYSEECEFFALSRASIIEMHCFYSKTVNSAIPSHITNHLLHCVQI
jgi:hypothetical protein